MITLILTLAVLMTTVFSAVSDVRSLRIPNLHCLIILVCFIPAYFATPDLFGGWIHHLGAVAVMFIVTYLMFTAGMMGGGDSKLGSALALWVGLPALLPFLFYMAVMGGVLGVATLYIRKHKPFKTPLTGSWVAQVQDGRNAVPYGVAISFGFWMALIHNDFLAKVFSGGYSLILTP
jgi:prepilin peptidase CpaA